MTLYSMRVTAFDGVTLHNGSTRYVETRVEQIERAQLQIITLPDGTKYDSTSAATDAPLVPGEVTAEITISESSAANAQTAFAAIAAKLGVHGTLTFTETSSATTYTCNARMSMVRNITPLPASLDGGFLKMAVGFNLLDNPA